LQQPFDLEGAVAVGVDAVPRVLLVAREQRLELDRAFSDRAEQRRVGDPHVRAAERLPSASTTRPLSASGVPPRRKVTKAGQVGFASTNGGSKRAGR